MKKEKISLAGLINKAAQAPDNCKVVILAVTVPTMNKTGKNDKGEKIANPYLDQDVTKESLMECTIKYNYTHEVNKQRLNEGKSLDFVAKQRTWGDKDGCFVTKNGQLYIDVKVDKTISSVYKIAGVETKKDVFVPFQSPAKAPSKTQEVFNEVAVRTLKVSSIKEIKFGDTTYELV